MGFEVEKRTRSTKLHAEGYIKNLAKRFEVMNAKERDTPASKAVLADEDLSSLIVNKTLFQSMLGGLGYVSNLCRPDVSYIVNRLAREGTSPRMLHLKVAKDVIKYLLITKEKGLIYNKSNKKRKRHLQLLPTQIGHRNRKNHDQ